MLFCYFHGKDTSFAFERSHIRKSVKQFSYNERTFSYCPAYTGRQTPRKADRYERMQPINREIYNSIRENILSAVYILSQDLGLLLPKKRLNACCGDIWLQKPICIAEKRCTISHGCFCIFQENIFRSGMSVSERKAGCMNFFAKEKISAFSLLFPKKGRKSCICVLKRQENGWIFGWILRSTRGICSPLSEW